MTELKPCPFCGGEAEVTTRDVEPQGDPWYGKNIQTFVICTNCGACLFDDYFHEGFADEHEATTAWNRRAQPDNKPRTNADRIRSMSDEDLAGWIDTMLNEDRDDWDVPGCYRCINYGTHHSDPKNKGTSLYECTGCYYEGSHENGLKHGVLTWLQQPYKEEK